MMKYALALLGFVLAVSPALAQETASADVLTNKGESAGLIVVREGPKGLLLGIDLKGLPPGAHGFHIHAVGDCSDHDHFKNASGHVKDNEADQHGLLNPQGPEAGDLPNLIVHADGTLKAEVYAPDLKIGGDDKGNILDADGSAFMIHANPDDHTTQPIGGAGDRIACGVIKASN